MKTPIDVDGDILYIEGLTKLDTSSYYEDGISDLLNIDTLKSALKPVVKVGKVIKDGMLELSPDEVEIAIHLQLGISSDKLAFALVNADAEAHFTVTYIWKASE